MVKNIIDNLDEHIGSRSKLGKFIHHSCDIHHSLVVVENLIEFNVGGFVLKHFHVDGFIHFVAGFRAVEDRAEKPFNDVHQTVLAVGGSRETQHMFGGDFLEGLDEHFRGNVVTFINHSEPEPSEYLFGILFHRNGLDHRNHNILSFNIRCFTLEMSDCYTGKERLDPVFPLIFEKRVVYDNEGLHFQLGRNVKGTHSLASAGLETDHPVVGFGFQVGVHHLYLGWADRTGKDPAIRRGGCDIERSRTPA